MTEMNLVQAIQSALRGALREDENVLLMGEDIGSLGGVFRVTQGLQEEFGPDRVLDTHNLTPVLLGKGESTREALFYYRAYKLMAVRMGPWKAHFITQDAYGQGSQKPVEHDTPLLFNLEVNPSESDAQNLAAKHPEVVKRLQAA